MKTFDPHEDDGGDSAEIPAEPEPLPRPLDITETVTYRVGNALVGLLEWGRPARNYSPDYLRRQGAAVLLALGVTVAGAWLVSHDSGKEQPPTVELDYREIDETESNN